MLKYILNVFTATFDQFNVSIQNKNINFLINVLSNPHCSYHISQGDVKEHATSKGKDDAGGKSATQQDAQDQAQVAGHSRQQVEEDGLWNTQPCVQQDNEVAYRGRQNANVLHMFLFFSWRSTFKGQHLQRGFGTGVKGQSWQHFLLGKWVRIFLTQLMREFLTDDSDRSAKAAENRHGERSADGQSVNEVVESIAEGNHPCHRLHAGQPSSSEPSAVPLQRRSHLN